MEYIIQEVRSSKKDNVLGPDGKRAWQYRITECSDDGKLCAFSKIYKDSTAGALLYYLISSAETSFDYLAFMVPDDHPQHSDKVPEEWIFRDSDNARFAHIVHHVMCRWDGGFFDPL